MAACRAVFPLAPPFSRVSSKENRLSKRGFTETLFKRKSRFSGDDAASAVFFFPALFG